MMEEETVEMTGFEDNDLPEDEGLRLPEDEEQQLPEVEEPALEDNMGTIDVYVEQFMWDWGEYFYNMSDDTVSVGLYLDEDGTELYGNTKTICFEDSDMQVAFFEHVPCGTYYVLLSDEDGIVHKTYDTWDKYYSWSNEKKGYNEFSYEVDEASTQVVQITPDEPSAQSYLNLIRKRIIPGYSYSGTLHLNVTCWDSEHNNTIEPEENIMLGLFRNGDDEYDRVFSYVHFDETINSPLLIADHGITSYDIYLMKVENRKYVKSEEEKYILTGNRHFELNSDEGLYEADIYLELQEKAEDTSDPIVSPEPTTSPEVIPTVSPEPTVTQTPLVTGDSIVTQAPTANVVDTGDESPVRIYLILMLIALAGMLGIFGKKISSTIYEKNIWRT